MSEHYISKEKKCWSCSYYVGNRKTEKGFLDFKVKCDSKGKCSNNRSFYKDKEVAEWVKCDRYEMWGVIESELAREADEKARRKEEKEAAKQEQLAEQERLERERDERYSRIEAERQEQENQAELKRQRRAIEEERQKLAEERKKLEYEKWYMTLSDDEKKAEDERVARENEEKLIKQQQEQEAARIRMQQIAVEQKRQAEIEKQRRVDEEQRQAARRRAEEVKRKKRNKILAFSLIGGIIAIILIIVISITVSNVNKANNPVNKIDKYLEQYNSTYTETVNSDGIYYNLTFSGKNGKYNVAFSASFASSQMKADRMTTSYTFEYGKIVSKNIAIYGTLYSGSNYKEVRFHSFSLGTCPNINSDYQTVYSTKVSQDYGDITSEELETLWAACCRTMRFANDFVKKVDSSYSLW